MNVLLRPETFYDGEIYRVTFRTAIYKSGNAKFLWTMESRKHKCHPISEKVEMDRGVKKVDV